MHNVNDLKCFLADLNGFGITALELRTFEVAVELRELAAKDGKCLSTAYRNWEKDKPAAAKQHGHLVWAYMNELQKEALK